MCGICYVKRVDGKSARKMVEKRYKLQKSRGTEGFGYVAIDDNFIVNYVRCRTEKGILKKLEAESANEIMFHHRFPTSTPNFRQCAHPIKVSNPKLMYDYYLIHNGVIFNDDVLKEKHEKEGFVYNTQVVNRWFNGTEVIEEESKYNDSESLAIELAQDLDKDAKGIDVRGTVAFIMLQVDKATKETVKLFFARNYGSPLVYDIDEGHYVAITSEGKGKIVLPNVLHSFDYRTNAVETKDYPVGISSYSGGYSRISGAHAEYAHQDYSYDRDDRWGYDVKDDESLWERNDKGVLCYVGHKKDREAKIEETAENAMKRLGFTDYRENKETEEKEETKGNLPYYNLIDEQSYLEDALLMEDDDDERWLIEERLKEIEALLTKYDDKEINDTLKQP